MEGVLWACGPNWNIMKEGSGREQEKEAEGGDQEGPGGRWGQGLV